MEGVNADLHYMEQRGGGADLPDGVRRPGGAGEGGQPGGDDGTISPAVGRGPAGVQLHGGQRPAGYPALAEPPEESGRPPAGAEGDSRLRQAGKGGYGPGSPRPGAVPGHAPPSRATAFKIERGRDIIRNMELEKLKGSLEQVAGLWRQEYRLLTDLSWLPRRAEWDGLQAAALNPQRLLDILFA